MRRRKTELQEALCATKAQELRVKLQHLHASDAKPEKSLVSMLDSIPDDGGSDTDSDGDGSSDYCSRPLNFPCLLCRKIGKTNNGVVQKQIIEHVSN